MVEDKASEASYTEQSFYNLLAQLTFKIHLELFSTRTLFKLGPAHQPKLGASMQRGGSFLLSVESAFEQSIINRETEKQRKKWGEEGRGADGGHRLVTPLQVLWAVSLVDAALKAMQFHYYVPFICHSSLCMICFLMFFFYHKRNYGSESKHSHQAAPKEVGRECPRNHLS